MKPSESTLLVVAYNREKVRHEELDTIEDIEIAKKQSYDEVIEARHKGWWESIEQLNVDEVSTFEAWLETFVFNMQNQLNQLEIGASSSDLGFNV
ncbi:hypothetical protein RDI58_029538 [Solanum bulbocastanum]|uniref:Uncharacterized protein n=1 Tax=Solanum bulbocastanum TaxID=147425 RepID=A0AAN8SQJ4_SOLBU